MDGGGTFNLLGIVDDEIAVPYDGELRCQVADLRTLVHVLKSKKKKRSECVESGYMESESQREIEDKLKKDAVELRG